MARRAGIGDDRLGPVAESVDARAMHRSLSWFKSRPGLQPSLLGSFGSASQLARYKYRDAVLSVRLSRKNAG
jgi:hypothetical protein